ncbi:SDR family oxidoreductase [Streptomyces spongiae]|uniref:SDR family oxidoreductase n=1 Tax=Streptomyces spongiae TaxID=565072 RepID=A0A5N8XAN7_9ACTN|nr:SDR family oxidoreductase [Streptomyces spongiae]MPY56512.1 SDR family oxidoreductase [Streptomyces spongiae]
MNGRLDGRVAVVTGGLSGIGAATVRRFLDEGAAVAAADLRTDRPFDVPADQAERLMVLTADVADEDDVRDVVDTAVRRFGHLDVMVNNAAVLGAIGPIADSDLAEADRTIAVNLRGVLLGMKHAARVMRPRRSGSIISTSSPAGLSGGQGPHVYSATKAAVIGLTRSVAAELRADLIRVNVVVPGATVTPMMADLTTGDAADLGGAAAAMTRTAWMGEPVRPQDVAETMLFLADDASRFVTGETISVDGGMTSAPGASPFLAERFAGTSAIFEGGRRTPRREKPEESDA